MKVAVARRSVQPKLRAVRPVEDDIARTHVNVVTEPVREDARARFTGHPTHVRIVPVQDGPPVPPSARTISAFSWRVASSDRSERLCSVPIPVTTAMSGRRTGG